MSAAVYYDLTARHEWPIVPAFLLAVVRRGTAHRPDPRPGRCSGTCAPRRRSPSSSPRSGLLVAMPEIVKLWFGDSPAFGAADDLAQPVRDLLVRRLRARRQPGGDAHRHRVAVLGLTVMFRYTTIGLQMRAVVESPRMTELAGVNADRVSTFSWMLSSLFAGPRRRAARAAVRAGAQHGELHDPAGRRHRRRRVRPAHEHPAGPARRPPARASPRALLAGYLPPDSVLAQGLRPSLPFAALFLLLLFWPGLRQQQEVTDPLSGVDPPPPEPGRGRPQTRAARTSRTASARS